MMSQKILSYPLRRLRPADVVDFGVELKLVGRGRSGPTRALGGGWRLVAALETREAHRGAGVLALAL